MIVRGIDGSGSTGGTVRINTGALKNRLDSMAAALETLCEEVQGVNDELDFKTKYVQENLKGKAWEQELDYIREISIPMVQNIKLWIEEQLRATNFYKTAYPT